MPARQLSTGTILVDEPVPARRGVAIYARVSSADQRGDLNRQVARLVEHVTTSGLSPTKVVFETALAAAGKAAL